MFYKGQNRLVQARDRKPQTMIRRLTGVGAGIAALACFAAPVFAADCSLDGETLSGSVRFFSTGGTYAETLDKVYFLPFQEECGVEVISVTSSRTYEQLTEMMKAGHYQYDLGGTLSGFEYPLGVEAGLYAKLPGNFWDATSATMENRGTSEYGAWSTSFSQVMAYNTDALPASFGENGWADFWDVEKYPGKRSLKSDPRSLVFALMADGVKREDLYPLDYDRAFRKLDELKPHVLFWWKAGDQPIQGILNKEVVASSAFNGRVWSPSRDGKPIAMNWNENLFQFGWNIVLKDAPNQRNAVALLHFMQRADRQAEQAKATAYTGANLAALKELSEEAAQALAVAHVDQSIPYDVVWWADNVKEASKRWNEWIAQ